MPFDGDMSIEDLIAEEDMVVTITRGGYAKRTRTDLYRSQQRGGKGVRGAQLRGDDIVEHFFVTTTHHWLLFFTNKGRVYRAKAYELPDAGRDARGQHVANLLAFQPDEQIAQVLDVRDYERRPYLVLATRGGLVKKTRAHRLRLEPQRRRHRDQPARATTSSICGASWSTTDDDLLLVSRQGQSVRFTATDEALRPMGRATSGVIGMRFREGDELLSMDVVRPDAYVSPPPTAATRSAPPSTSTASRAAAVSASRRMKIVEDRGSLVGALVVEEADEILAITSAAV